MLQQKRLAEAQKAFEEGLRIDPTEYRAHYFLGGICEATKTCSFSQRFHAVLQLAPRDSQEYATAQSKAGHIPKSDYSKFHIPKVGSRWEATTLFDGKAYSGLSRVVSVTNDAFIVETTAQGTTVRSKYGMDGNEIEGEVPAYPANVVKVTYLPSTRFLDFPLLIGKSWSMNYVQEDGGRRTTVTGRATAKGYETVSSKNGDIEAMRIEFRTTDRVKTSTGEEAGITVSGTCLYVPGFPGCYILLDEKGETTNAIVSYDLKF